MEFRQKILDYFHLSEQDYLQLTKPLEELSLPDFNAPPDM